MKILFLKYGIACLLLAVTFLHLYFVRTKNLSVWKGGGFGMYSTAHHNHREIWIRAGKLGAWMPIDSLGIFPNSLEIHKNDLLRRPFKKNLEKFGEKLCNFKNYNSIELEIWQPDLASNSGGFQKNRLHTIQSHATKP